MDTSCKKSKIKQQNMEENKPVIELVLFKTNKGVKAEEAQETLKELNKMLKAQKGFISRKTAMAEDGQFLDLVYWEDLESAQKASKEIMKNEKAVTIFNIIDNKTMTFNHFKKFNSFNN